MDLGQIILVITAVISMSCVLLLLWGWRNQKRSDNKFVKNLEEMKAKALGPHYAMQRPLQPGSLKPIPPPERPEYICPHCHKYEGANTHRDCDAKAKAKAMKRMLKTIKELKESKKTGTRSIGPQ